MCVKATVLGTVSISLTLPHTATSYKDATSNYILPVPSASRPAHPLCARQLPGCPHPALEPQATPCTCQGLHHELQERIWELGGGLCLYLCVHVCLCVGRSREEVCVCVFVGGS